MLGAVGNSQIGCKVVDQFVYALAYADDLVLIAPSWRALQAWSPISLIQSRDGNQHVVQCK